MIMESRLLVDLNGGAQLGKFIEKAVTNLSILHSNRWSIRLPR